MSSPKYLPLFSVFHDHHWCRAVIHCFFSEAKQHLMLRLVDLGKITKVPVGDVKTNLPEEFLVEPGLAIWCHLEGIILPESLHSVVLSHVMEEVTSPDTHYVGA